jgi:GT2 family glycosyltransferase
MPPCQIIIVDGGSTDGTQEKIRSYPVELLIQDRRGHIYAYNYGARMAKGEIVAFIDDDAIAKHDWIEQLQNNYEISEKVGAVGGRIINTGKMPLFSTETISKSSEKFLRILLNTYNIVFLENRIDEVGVIMRNGAAVGNFSKEIKRPVKVNHIRGANMSFRKDMLKKIGYFDTRFDLGHATLFETDACLRAGKAGFEIWYNPHAIVWHSIRSEGSDAISLAHNDLLFYLKNIRNVNSDRSDVAFVLRFLSQLIYDIFIHEKREDGLMHLLKNLFEIPPTIARSFVVSHR